MIRIIDCGSQLTQNIARRIREEKVFTEILPHHASIGDIKNNELEGIIISGGQFSVYDENAPKYTKEIFSLGVPVLGICYGQQSIANLLGGRVSPTENREYGATKITLENGSPLYEGISKRELNVWMSHADVVESLPRGFQVLARSQNGHVASMQGNNIYAVQFHPEVDHTEYGRKILKNFLNICQAKRTWDPEKAYDNLVDSIKEKVEGKIGIGGISGGVDSTTASVLLKKIAGDNFHPIFVDNGLLRLNESEEVRGYLSELDVRAHFINASERNLSKLASIVNPDEKRKIIGHEFIEVFEEEARKIKGATYLLQGTLYPDVIESVPIYGSSSKIKRHHNVGGLPEKMGLELIEPFRELFKDEVRKIAEHKLGIPKEIVWRHPFPGPGLAIRIVGQDVTKKKLEIVRQADAIFIEELKNRGLYYQISQAFAGLGPSQNVGVMGDEGTYEAEIKLRAVTTNDFMTSDWYDFNKEDFTVINNRIVNEVKGVNRTSYDTTQKPPGTIEWE